MHELLKKKNGYQNLCSQVSLRTQLKVVWGFLKFVRKLHVIFEFTGKINALLGK